MALSDHAKALDDPALKAYPKTAVFIGADSLNVAAAAAVAFWELSK